MTKSLIPSTLSRFLGACVIGFSCQNAMADLASDVVGSWKLVSHMSSFNGSQFDSRAALFQQRPCAEKILYNVNPDGTYRLDASASGCDDQYKAVQEKLYSKTRWKVEGNRLTTSATNFAVGQTYTVTVSGNRMTWVGTDGQGTLVYQKHGR